MTKAEMLEIVLLEELKKADEYMKKERLKKKIGGKEMINKFKEIVREYAEQHLDATDGKIKFDVYVVWSCKTLQNYKALLSTNLADGMYYELTFNGDKNEIYLDAYKKFENKCIKE